MWRNSHLVMVALFVCSLSGCPDPRQNQLPLYDASVDTQDTADTHDWNENWWWDFVNQDYDYEEYDHPTVVSFSPEPEAKYRRSIPDFVVTFDRPMNTQVCMQHIQVKINPHGEPQRDWAGEWSWNANATTVTFSPVLAILNVVDVGMRIISAPTPSRKTT